MESFDDANMGVKYVNSPALNTRLTVVLPNQLFVKDLFII